MSILNKSANISDTLSLRMQTTLFKKMLGSTLPNFNFPQASIFPKQNTDVFTFSANLLSDMLNAKIYSKYAQSQKQDTPIIPKAPKVSSPENSDLDGIILDEDGFPASGYVIVADDRIKWREERNDRISDFLHKNGFELSDDELYNFSVNSGTLKVTVTGKNEQSEKRAGKLEKLLNDNHFAAEILAATSEVSSRHDGLSTKLEDYKYYANTTLKQHFGCSLADITFDEKGVAYLPSGKSVADALAEEPKTAAYLASGDSTKLQLGIASIECVTSTLDDLHQAGIENIDDIKLNIDYDSSGYIDTMLHGYGFGKGQMAWYDKLKSLRGNYSALNAYGEELFG